MKITNIATINSGEYMGIDISTIMTTTTDEELDKIFDEFIELRLIESEEIDDNDKGKKRSYKLTKKGLQYKLLLTQVMEESLK